MSAVVWSLVRQRQAGPSPCCGLWLAELGEWRGREPMSAPAGRDGWVISGRKGQKVKGGHGLVAVAARVRRTETDRRGKETKKKKGHIKGDIKRKKDRKEISVS